MKDYIISVSYGNYNDSLGGTDKVILGHQKIFNDNDITMIHIYGLSLETSRFPIKRGDLWQVYEDGVYVGIKTTKQLCYLFYRRNSSGSTLRGIYIHHLRTINLEELTKIINYTKHTAYLYIHDLYTICPTRGMVDSKDNFCGKGLPSEKKCRDCAFYDPKRTGQVVDFLKANINKIHCIAPSEVAKNIWLSAYPEYEGKVIVIPHQKLIGEYLGNRDQVHDNCPLKIAFIGAQHKKKGWNYFEQAVNALAEKNHNISFYHFGRTEIKNPKIFEVEVDFHQAETSMVNQLRKYNIDIAILWSVLPETYSFTYFEAHAANCFVLTNSMSGNIALQTEKLRNGIVAGSPTDLYTCLEDEIRLRDLVNTFKNSGTIGPSTLSDNDQILETLSISCEEMEKPMGSTISDMLFVNVYRGVTNLLKHR